MLLKYKIRSFDIMNLSISENESKKNRKVYKSANRDKNTKEHSPKTGYSGYKSKYYQQREILYQMKTGDKEICPKSESPN